MIATQRPVRIDVVHKRLERQVKVNKKWCSLEVLPYMETSHHLLLSCFRMLCAVTFSALPSHQAHIIIRALLLHSCPSPRLSSSSDWILPVAAPVEVAAVAEVLAPVFPSWKLRAGWIAARPSLWLGRRGHIFS